MNERQRAAALRLADTLDRCGGINAETEAAALLRELAAEPVQDMQKALRDAQHTADFYRRRCEALQQWQSRMRDPERTVVCDILANGFTLDPPVPHDRYAMAAEPVQEPECQYAKDVGMPEYRCAVKCQYAAPQQRKPLTEEQIDKLLDAERMKWTTRTWPPAHEFAAAFARAIEKAHGIVEEA